MTTSSGRMPSQIKYIVGNEACERFSYYGMAAILFPYMKILMDETVAKSRYHEFVMCAYLTPLLGAYLSDRFLGKYRTIIYLSLVYCAGHAVLSLTEGSLTGLYLGLGLIALGAGGIKPCVSAHVGDQFTQRNKSLVQRAFSYFYWTINLGSFFSTLLIPWTKDRFGWSVAFAIPGVLMFLATIVFWMGRRQFVHVPPTGRNPHSFSRVAWSMARGRAGEHPPDAVEGVRAVLRIAALFASVPLFWTLFHQHGSSWTAQAGELDRRMLGMNLQPEQVQALNPLLVLTLVPLFTFLVYPWLKRRGLDASAPRKIAVGMVFTALSYVAIALIQAAIDGDPTKRLEVIDDKEVMVSSVSAAWQIAPYVLLTIGEILVSITGLEFAYTQAPRAMKSTIMSLWMLAISIGNEISAVVFKLSWFKTLSGANKFYFFAAAMGGVTLIFAWVGSRYRIVDYVNRDDSIARPASDDLPLSAPAAR